MKEPLVNEIWLEIKASDGIIGKRYVIKGFEIASGYRVVKYRNLVTGRNHTALPERFNDGADSRCNAYIFTGERIK